MGLLLSDHVTINLIYSMLLRVLRTEKDKTGDSVNLIQTSLCSKACCLHGDQHSPWPLFTIGTQLPQKPPAPPLSSTWPSGNDLLPCLSTWAQCEAGLFMKLCLLKCSQSRKQTISPVGRKLPLSSLTSPSRNIRGKTVLTSQWAYSFPPGP